MNQKQIGGGAVLLLAAVLTVALQAGAPPPTEEPSAGEADRERVHQVLRDYFSARYSEAACSAVYTDLTHDGLEELLVLELASDPAGEPVLLHAGALDPDRFTEGHVTVLQASPDGAVETLYTYACGADPGAWGGLYLQKEDGSAYLLRKGGGREERFFLSGSGNEIAAPEEGAPSLDAKPVIVYDPAAGTGQSRFSCLDELFTTY